MRAGEGGRRQFVALYERIQIVEQLLHCHAVPIVILIVGRAVVGEETQRSEGRIACRLSIEMLLDQRAMPILHGAPLDTEIE